MKPSSFRYHDPERLHEALDIVAEVGGDAALLAGGQSLVPMMNLRLVQPADVVDLNLLDELTGIRRENGHLAIGAMTRHRVLESSKEVARHAALIAEAMPHVAYPAIRARGTVGGSVAHADPAAELSCVLRASEATIVLASKEDRREIASADFFQGPYMTARHPQEILVEIRVPLLPSGTATAFREFARKRGDFALVLAAVALTLDSGRCVRARVVIGGAGSVPVRSATAEHALEGEELDQTHLAVAAEAAAGEVQPTGDAHGSADYRRRLVAVEVRRALETALARDAESRRG